MWKSGKKKVYYLKSLKKSVLWTIGPFSNTQEVMMMAASGWDDDNGNEKKYGKRVMCFECESMRLRAAILREKFEF